MDAGGPNFHVTPLATLEAVRSTFLRRWKRLTQADQDNHSNQCNPNNDAYWESRGEDGRPDDWEERAEQEDE